MNTGLHDSELISRVLRGDTHHFAELVTRYQRLVFSIAQRYTSQREDAEEIAQDVFVKAYRNLADFRGESKFSTWLFTIANTTCLSFLRKKKLSIQSLDNEDLYTQVAERDSGLQANQIEHKSRAQLVNKAIQLLNPDDAQLILLFYKGEQSLEEIGHILGMEPNTVKVKLFRARQRLKQKMEKKYSAEVKDILG